MSASGDAAVTTTDLPERFDLSSEVPYDDRLDAIGAAFPEAVCDGKIDFDALRRSLGDWVEPGPERFGLTWPGKAECTRVIQEPSIGTLVPMPGDSVDWDTTQNVIVEGDNLEVLKLLQKAYYGKVKLIYVDPPYNTGKEFIYPDNFREGLADYLRYSGQTDEEGMKLTANAETDGRYHSKWLSMMYPRLFLARNLLREDGLIFVSIDDHEGHNLRALMNEIFGEENFVATVIWEKIHTRKNSAQYMSENHDYLLVFARNKARCTIQLLPRPEELDAGYTNRDNDPRGPWADGPVQARNYYSKGRYAITCPSGRVIAGPPPGRYWSVAKEEFEALDADDRVWWGETGNNVPRIKRFLSEVKAGIVPQTIWPHAEVGHTQEAKADLLNRVSFGEIDSMFETPKPVRLIERVVQLATTDDPQADDIVLDFFAGSGTTGEAVLRANTEDGGTRRYVLVQLPEPVDDERYNTISAITRGRLQAVGAEIQPEPSLGSESLDAGFRAYNLAPSNFAVWDTRAKTPDELAEQLELSADSQVRESATEEAMLAELLLKAGYLLTSPVERVDVGGGAAFSIDDGALLVCLESELTIEAFEAMAERDPAMILVLDSGFGGSDELKVNALQTVRARNQQSGSDIALRVV
jgi:adenine-specific DNA-methyltransferase